jgi:TRAP-type mannitol/chloroaromatic compound transport system substrate-binding protein
VELLSGGEIYPALERGRLDATEFSMPSIDERLGFYKVAPYNYFPGWHQQATLLELIINKDVWNGLSASQQALVEMGCREAVARSYAAGEAGQFTAMREGVAKHGVKLMKWSPEMLTLFEQTWHVVVAEECAKDAFFQQVWDDLAQFRKSYRLWGSHAFLPRATAP